MGLLFSLALFPALPKPGALGSPAHWLQCARAAEYAGLHGLSINTGARRLDGLSIAALLAPRTHHLQLSASIATGLLLPTALAASARSLQGLSGGRLQLHLIDGVQPTLCQLSGEALNRDQQRERNAEYLHILQHLLAPESEPLDFAGRYFQVEQAGLGQPARSRPPLALDAGADPAQLAAYADLCLLHDPHPRQIESEIQRLRHYANGAGRSITFACTLGMIVDSEEKRAWALADQQWAAQIAADPAPDRCASPGVAHLRCTADSVRRFEIHPNLFRPGPGRPAQLVGTPHQIITRLQELEALGVEHIVLDLYPQLPQLMRFVDWVLPVFKSIGTSMQGQHHDHT